MNGLPFPVILEDDPTPLVLSVGRTLRASARVPELLLEMEALKETVVVKSKDDPQAATMRFAHGRVRVGHGTAPEPHIVLSVNLADRFAVESVGGREPGSPAVDAVRRILKPPLPSWRDAAQRFWEFTSAGTGMPHQLVVACAEEELVLGAGSPRYFIGGDPEKLSRVLTGTDVFLDEVYAGSIAVRGTMTQLSVMAGAAMKVRFHG